MSSDGGRPVNGVVLSAAIDCPGESRAGRGEKEDSAPSLPPARLVDRTDSRERAVLMRAFSWANSRLVDDQPHLGPECAAVVRSAQRVRRAVDAVDRFRYTGGARPAVRWARWVERRHARDDAADAAGKPRRPRRTRMWHWLAVLMAVVGGVFDSVFVASVVQEILGVDTESWQYWLAFLPGSGITVCLLVAGTFLAERMAAPREARASSAGVGARGGEGRKGLLAPWLFTLAVLGLIAVIGSVRVGLEVEASGDSYLAAYQPVAVLVLLLLGIGAVATKVLSHNPEEPVDAESARVEKAARAAEKASDGLTDEARKALAEHVTAWFALKASVDAAENVALRNVEDASTGLVEERARTGTAGTFDFPLRAPSWPPDVRSGAGCPRRAHRPPVPSEGGPTVGLGLLQEARDILSSHRPAELSQLLRNALDELNAQWRPASADGSEKHVGTARSEDGGHEEPEPPPADEANEAHEEAPESAPEEEGRTGEHGTSGS
ncbi:hypothetical protein ACFRH6_01575 [Streptomyces sp. NPDC056749]|uniref:hypothetical protein n=1 Tax=Streptomyces sp. NPDC056749 TaxID=3345936 RepID=UPI00368E3F27